MKSDRADQHGVPRRLFELKKFGKNKKGGYAGGKPPISYKVKEGEFIIVPEEAEIVRKVFELRSKGGTLIGIADELDRLGYTTKIGRKFHHSAIQTILSNEDTYRGVYRYGNGTDVPNHHEPILKE